MRLGFAPRFSLCTAWASVHGIHLAFGQLIPDWTISGDSSRGVTQSAEASDGEKGSELETVEVTELEK